MDSSINEDIETLDEGIVASDDFDDTFDIGADDDPIKDTEIDQVVDEKLNCDIEQIVDTIISEPEQSNIYIDEEKDSDDTGLEDSDVSLLSNDEEVSTRSSSRLESTPVLGRGRYAKKAVDKNNQELPEPVIHEIPAEKGFYSAPTKLAKLPLSYYRKRESSEEFNARRIPPVLNPLINFQASFNQLSFIVDKDDSEEKGYQHGCKILEKILKFNIEKKPHYDQWHFGLYNYLILLDKNSSCDLLHLFPQEINNEDNRPFWFMFKRPPKFVDRKLNDIPPSKQDDLRKGTFIQIDRTTYADLAYGALTSMSRFCIHKDYIFRQRTNWSLRFVDEFFEIQTIELDKSCSYSKPIIIKRKITLDIIDRVAIFRLWNNGFSLFLNMKGNVHVLHRECKSKDVQSIFEQFKRQGICKNKKIPLFTTIRLRFRINDDKRIIENFERDKKNQQNLSSEEKNRILKNAREESLNAIRELFRNFLDFFYKNRIQVCFGSISSKNISLEQLNTIYNQRFSTFIQSYSWSMLCSISFRVQILLSLEKEFIDQLNNYSKLHYDEIDQSADIDDRFYRLCLYLHRRSSEYIFLDLVQEIRIGIHIYKTKYERSKQKKLPMRKFYEVKIGTAYIPSVILTPTIISIRPLKLCKLNRVLREKQFGGYFNFALVELRDEAQRLLFPSEYRALKNQIHNYLTNGFLLTPTRTYKYLHHSQSQVKSKQFWFYYSDIENKYLSHEDAYAWMGNFDKERVVAKHAARIALCFTSTDATIQIPANIVTYIRDIKDETKKYAFTDGVGTISTKLRDQIKEFINCHHDFSVLQIRYGGCKGTLSIDPRLDDNKEPYKLKIRDSMNKFTTDHDILELCKLSAPRALFLNRQDIVLLESRDIPHINFLILQNEDHLWLINSLLTSSIAYELLHEKLLPIFKLHDIARNINIVEEQFFIKLIITCAFNIIRELLERTRIRISNKTARNMFGIVDEYGVLEYGQVFIQYSTIRENKLDLRKNEENLNFIEEDINHFQQDNIDKFKILKCEVVITKNPCHHPGDLRKFQAVDYPVLRHLKDVVVFPQKGLRPHSNEISGSDLDGDEYVVIWHDDLIPETSNEDAYKYDSQEDPPKMTRPITREDINQVVMDVSEQDCLGSLSNIHLAYADRDGIKSTICTDLAGAISQEVDAAKTGKHPLTEEEITKLREGLKKTWPDFMKARGKKEYYPSQRILGKLYRSARRAVMGWSRAISNHGNPRHIRLALSLTTGTDIKDEENDENISKTNNLTIYEQPLDPYIYHPDYKKYLSDIKQLYSIYQHELLEIISLYRFQDEIDLFCRCDSMDSLAGGGKKGSLEDSAAIEIENLIQRIRQDFFSEFDRRRKNNKCCRYEKNPYNDHMIIIDCKICKEDKLAKAACAYIYSYQENNRLPLKSNRRIFSFPWYFSNYLIELKSRNQPEDFVDQSNTLVGRALSSYLNDFIPKFKVFIPENSIDIQTVEFVYKKIEEKPTILLRSNKKLDEKIPFVSLLRACFVEILNDWLIKQNIFGEICTETDQKPLIPKLIWHELLVNFLSYEYQPNVHLLDASESQKIIIDRYRQTINNYRLKWTNIEYIDLQKMFNEIHLIALRHARRTKLTIWTYLDEYIMLALQCIGIEKRLVDQWICPTNSL